MYCPECGEKLEEGAVYCPYCGERVEGPAANEVGDLTSSDSAMTDYSQKVIAPLEVPWSHAAKPTAPDRRVKLSVIIISVIAVAVVVCGAFFAYRVLHPSDASGAAGSSEGSSSAAAATADEGTAFTPLTVIQSHGESIYYADSVDSMEISRASVLPGGISATAFTYADDRLVYVNDHQGVGQLNVSKADGSGVQQVCAKAQTKGALLSAIGVYGDSLLYVNRGGTTAKRGLCSYDLGDGTVSCLVKDDMPTNLALVGVNDGRAYFLEASNGSAELKSVSLGGGDVQKCCEFSLDDNLAPLGMSGNSIVVGYGQSGTSTQRIVCLDLYGTERWSADGVAVNGDGKPAVVVADGTVYYVDGKESAVHRVDVSTGVDTATKLTNTGVMPTELIALDGDRLYFKAGEDIYVLDDV